MAQTKTTDIGVTINNIKWATRNVDAPNTFAPNPECVGMLYQWNRKIGWSSTDPVNEYNCDTLWRRYLIDNIWEKVNDPCPAGWRVPTDTELQSLANAANEKTTLNGVNGRVFGNDNNTLFLPLEDGYGGSNGAVCLMDGAWGSWINTTTSLSPDNRFVISRFRVRCVAED
ncbi:MAG: fibrobacter succinogenes major paralogous domain-containing protein [Lentimicrobiaceae bacterium]|nr:fibrobacter succinogenes major paralogous domain-containing protein [Lentimicrobiaceae bacterium]